MFKKKICKNCNKKISDKFSFCPNCGRSINENKENYGMLGRNDNLNDPFEELSKNMFGGISGKMFNKMLGGAMKMLEKEMQKSMKPENMKTNFELYINGKKIPAENIKITKKPISVKPEKKQTHQNIFSEENLKKFSSLPKKEPSANVRRLSDKVVYEIEVPGVKSIQDILINKLENSIEIKAIAKNTAYKKILQVDLPLKRYKLDKEKLVLELGVKE